MVIVLPCVEINVPPPPSKRYSMLDTESGHLTVAVTTPSRTLISTDGAGAKGRLLGTAVLVGEGVGVGVAPGTTVGVGLGVGVTPGTAVGVGVGWFGELGHVSVRLTGVLQSDHAAR